MATKDVAKAPILIIGFNRPDLLSLTLKQVQNCHNRNIYISIDGPRNDAEKFLTNQCVSLTQKFIKENKALNVKLQLHSSNLGCKKGVISAIDWVFNFEPRAIIIEDDIIFNNNFLDFCDLGLEEFQDQKDIWQLNGWSPSENTNKILNFYKTKHAHIWGWATWKDRWEKNDHSLSNWDGNNPSNIPFLNDYKHFPQFDKYWKNQLINCKTGKTDTWDTQWLFTMWFHGCFAISPDSTLCGNRGFDARATHTKQSNGKVFEKHPDMNQLVFIDNLRKFDISLKFDAVHDEIAYGLKKNSNDSRKYFRTLVKNLVAESEFFVKFYTNLNSWLRK